MALMRPKNNRTRPNTYTSPKRKRASFLSGTKAAPEKAPSQAVVKKQRAVAAFKNFQHHVAIALLSCGLLLVLGCFALAILQGYNAAMTSSFFAVSNIEVQGNSYLSKEDILTLAGVSEGANSLTVSLSDVEKNILENPWVESVSIHRRLPSEFIINIIERVPKFWVLKDNVLHYIDKHGQLIAPVAGSKFISLPALDIGPGGENAIEDLDQFIDLIRNTELPFDVSQISWLRISAGNGFELYWEKKKLFLCIGLDNWKANLIRLALVLEDIEKREEIAAVREVRASNGQVWVQRG